MSRLTRAERSEANRRAILASARQHFEQFGYHGASVDAIADDAGFSKGAIYSQFGSKDELMLAVLEASVEERQRATERFAESLDTSGLIGDVMGDAFSVSLRTPAWQAALVEFRIHAWRHPELNDRYQALHNRTIDKVAATLARVLDRLDVTTDHQPRDLAIAVLAANTGLVIESFASHVDVGEFVRVIGTLVRPEPLTSRATT
jgi:AcrR family transcriptional regulator